jgi:hypothetical protein
MNTTCAMKDMMSGDLSVDDRWPHEFQIKEYVRREHIIDGAPTATTPPTSMNSKTNTLGTSLGAVASAVSEPCSWSVGAGGALVRPAAHEMASAPLAPTPEAPGVQTGDRGPRGSDDDDAVGARDAWADWLATLDMTLVHRAFEEHEAAKALALGLGPRAADGTVYNLRGQWELQPPSEHSAPKTLHSQFTTPALDVDPRPQQMATEWRDAALGAGGRQAPAEREAFRTRPSPPGASTQP